MWQRINSGKNFALENMKRDQNFLMQTSSSQNAIFHCYDWLRPSATYGYFVKPEEFLSIHELDLARRPTGGGIVFHLCDLAFSVIVPSSHPLYSTQSLINYQTINRCVIKALELTRIDLQKGELLENDPLPLDESCKNFCMAKPTIYDVMINQKKIGGAAQRKTKTGFLHQGTISISKIDPHYLKSLLKPGSKVFDAMNANSAFIIPEVLTPKELDIWRLKISNALWEVFRNS